MNKVFGSSEQDEPPLERIGLPLFGDRYRCAYLSVLQSHLKPNLLARIFDVGFGYDCTLFGCRAGDYE
jgi:hypothetical protein